MNIHIWMLIVHPLVTVEIHTFAEKTGILTPTPCRSPQSALGIRARVHAQHGFLRLIIQLYPSHPLMPQVSASAIGVALAMASMAMAMATEPPDVSCASPF